MNNKPSMSKRAIRVATAVALVAVMAVIAASLLLTGVGGATAFNADASDSAMRHMPIPAQYTEQCSNGIAVPNPADNAGLVADCAVLLVSKETLEGTLNWSTDRAISDWYGVVITNNRVSGLDRSDLAGEIPAELGNLTNLEHLYLRGNDLTGEIPAELGNLSNLDDLRLNKTRLTGAIPPELGNLANLRTLYLINNQLTGEIPAELGNLANLTSLSLAANRLTGEIPPELGNRNLSNFWSLNLNSNELTGEIPPELGNLFYLRYLNLYENQLTGEIPARLGNLANLRTLFLHDNQLTGAIPPELSNLASLEYLHLQRNQLTGAIPSLLGNLVNLTELRLHGNQFTGCIPQSLNARFVGWVDVDVIGLPICGATAASNDVMNRLIALERQLAEILGRLAALEGGSAIAQPSPTPTATPSATPTSVAGTSGDDACIERLAGNGSVNGSWMPACLTANSPDNRTYYARFYTFTLYAASEVTITLSSADATPYLFLLDGEGTDGAVKQENGAANTTSATITATLQPGAYTIEASTYRSETAGDFTLEMEVAR